MHSQSQVSYEKQVQLALRRPCIALSVNIMLLYKEINNKYCMERRRRGPGPKYNDGYDDKNGHYLVVAGEEISHRYTVQDVLGKGSFGTVLRCCDEKYQEPVALKIIRSGAYFTNQGIVEVDILIKLNSNKILDQLVVRLRKVFMWQKHLVLVFDLMSFNLYHLLRYTKFNGVSLDLTRKFAYQLLQVLKQLENHKPPIIHCDLKPENVLLCDPNRSGIRVIDFGSACYEVENSQLVKYIQSRFYRAPEVILELGYTTAIDRWSLGCMLVELHTGVPLFGGKNEVEQIGRFTGVLGPLPEEMIRASERRELFYHELPVGVDPASLAQVDDGASAGHVGGPASPEGSVQRLSSSSGAPAPGVTCHSAPQQPRGGKQVARGASKTPNAVSNTAPNRSNSASSKLTVSDKKHARGGFVRPSTSFAKASSSASQPTIALSFPKARHTRTSHGTPTGTVRGNTGGGGTPRLQRQPPRSGTAGGKAEKPVPSRTAAAPPGGGPVPTSSTPSSNPPVATHFVLRNPAPPELRRSLWDILGVDSGGPRGCRARQPGHDEVTYSHFYDLVSRLLHYEPSKRITCTEALRHPFLEPLLELDAQAMASNRS